MIKDPKKRRASESKWKSEHPALHVRMDIDTIRELDEYVKRHKSKSRHRAIVELIEWGLMDDAEKRGEAYNGAESSDRRRVRNSEYRLGSGNPEHVVGGGNTWDRAKRFDE